MEDFIMAMIKIALCISALYGFGMWIYTFVKLVMHAPLTTSEAQQYADFTFRLGLCAIIASGLLGIIIVLGG